MKRIRGFRLGRRLSMAWRWAFRQRRSRCRQPKRYLRLDCADVAARREAPASVAAKLFGWTRHLARRLKGAGGGGSGRYRRLGEERRLGSPLLEDLGGGDAWKKPPPKGFLAVYVGGKKKDEEEAGGGGGTPRRYLVPVIYFNHPLFGELLREAEEEFGFHHPGGITIPCPAAKFERVRTRIDAAAESLRWKSTKSFAGFSL